MEKITPLEALDKVKGSLVEIEEDGIFLSAWQNCEEETDIIEKELRALEIVKEKDVNVHNFKEVLIKQDWTYEQYLDEENDTNTSGHQFAYKLLIKEEYDLLKEVL